MNDSKISQECPVCLSDDQEPYFFTCEHQGCRACVYRWIQDQTSQGLEKIKCISSKCSVEVEQWRLQDLLNSEELEKYNMLLLNKTVSSFNDSIWCPKGCGNVIAVNDPKITRIHCLKCKTEFCFQCKTGWHPELSCEENKSSTNVDDNERKFLNFISKNSKQCPNNRCGAWIEKISGCNAVTCSSCGVQFDWNNGKAFTTDHGWGTQRIGFEENGRIIPMWEKEAIDHFFNKVPGKFRKQILEELLKREDLETYVPAPIKNLPIIEDNADAGPLFGPALRGPLARNVMRRQEEVPFPRNDEERKWNEKTDAEIKRACKFRNLQSNGTREQQIRRVVNHDSHQRY